MQAAASSRRRGPRASGCRRSAVLRLPRKQPSRDAFVVDSADVDEQLAKAAIDRQGDVSASVSDARLDWRRRAPSRTCSGDKATVWSPPSRRIRRGAAWRCCSACRSTTCASSSRAAPAATASTAPTRYRSMRRCCRRRSESLCAFSSRAETRWRGRTTVFAYVIDQRSAIAADGTIVAWDYEAWYRITRRPARVRHARQRRDRACSPGFAPAPFSPRSAPAPAGGFNNGSNAAPSYVAGRVGGTAGGTGTIASERVLTHTVQSPFFTGPLRSPSRLQNTFAHECFIDEIAAAVKADPVAYRLRHLRDPATEGGRRGGGEGREVGRASVPEARWAPHRRRDGARDCLRPLRRGQRIRGDGRPKSMSIRPPVQ